MCTYSQRQRPRTQTAFTRWQAARRMPALRRWLGLALSLAVLQHATLAGASEIYPATLQSWFSLDQEPACTLCHRDNDGEKDTVVRPFGRALMNAGATGSNNLAALESALQTLIDERTDSDGDGRADVQELAMGGDPNQARDEPPAAGDRGDQEASAASSGGSSAGGSSAGGNSGGASADAAAPVSAGGAAGQAESPASALDSSTSSHSVGGGNAAPQAGIPALETGCRLQPGSPTRWPALVFSLTLAASFASRRRPTRGPTSRLRWRFASTLPNQLANVTPLSNHPCTLRPKPVIDGTRRETP